MANTVDSDETAHYEEQVLALASSALVVFGAFSFRVKYRFSVLTITVSTERYQHPKLKDHLAYTVKFLNFGTPEMFALIYKILTKRPNL